MDQTQCLVSFGCSGSFPLLRFWSSEVSREPCAPPYCVVRGGIFGAGKLVYRVGEAASVRPSERSMAERQLCTWLPLSVAGQWLWAPPGSRMGLAVREGAL